MPPENQSSPKTQARPAYARGRPRAETTTEISTAIMDAAAACFLNLGYEQASMEAIAAAAGVTKVTLYKRFPDKRSLLQAVLHARRPGWTSPPASSAQTANTEARLKSLASVVLVRGVSTELRAFHALVASAWPDPLDMPAREEVLGYNDMLARLDAEIRKGSKDLGIVPSDAASVALALMAMLSGWFEHRIPDPKTDAADADAFAKRAVDLLIGGKSAW